MIKLQRLEHPKPIPISVTESSPGYWRIILGDDYVLADGLSERTARTFAAGPALLSLALSMTNVTHPCNLDVRTLFGKLGFEVEDDL